MPARSRTVTAAAPSGAAARPSPCRCPAPAVRGGGQAGRGQRSTRQDVLRGPPSGGAGFAWTSASRRLRQAGHDDRCRPACRCVRPGRSPSSSSSNVASLRCPSRQGSLIGRPTVSIARTIAPERQPRTPARCQRWRRFRGYRQPSARRRRHTWSFSGSTCRTARRSCWRSRKSRSSSGPGARSRQRFHLLLQPWRAPLGMERWCAASERDCAWCDRSSRAGFRTDARVAGAGRAPGKPPAARLRHPAAPDQTTWHSAAAGAAERRTGPAPRPAARQPGLRWASRRRCRAHPYWIRRGTSGEPNYAVTAARAANNGEEVCLSGCSERLKKRQQRHLSQNRLNKTRACGIWA